MAKTKMIRGRGRGKKSATKGRRLYKGGSVGFTQPMNFAEIPKHDYYPLNTYDTDPSRSPLLQSSTQSGGSKKSRKNRKGMRKLTKGGRSKRMMRGGDPLLGKTASYVPVVQIPGVSSANVMAHTLASVELPANGPALSYSNFSNSLV
jgi:hypothetical protein